MINYLVNSLMDSIKTTIITYECDIFMDDDKKKTYITDIIKLFVEVFVPKINSDEKNC